MPSNAPRLAFLGIADRASMLPDALGIPKLNVIGLTNLAASFIFPTMVPGPGLLFSIFAPAPGDRFVVILRNERTRVTVGTTTVELHADSTSTQTIAGTSATVEPMRVLRGSEGTWITTLAPNTMSEFLIPEPGVYGVYIVDESIDRLIGFLHFLQVDPPALTAARIAAIRASPVAAKAVRVQIECKTCNGLLRAYAALERGVDNEGATWYEDLPDSFSCQCRNLNVDLTTTRRNLHGLLGSAMSSGREVSIANLYDQAHVVGVTRRYCELIDKSQSEEEVHLFMKENPLTLHQFSPVELHSKLSLLGLRTTDFVVLNSRRELILVEIEKPSTKIMKDDGGLHSELQHAFDQVREWLHICDDQRSAVLQTIGIDGSRVGSVRGVVIAGRDASHDVSKLRRLKGNDYGRVTWMTFDDIAMSLASVARAMSPPRTA